jgi:acetyltransferase-like isoleucine patch superfamily enzyme
MGAQIGPRCRLAAVEVPRNPWDIRLEDGVALDRGVVLLSTGERRKVPRISIGSRTYVNRFTIFDASLSITVGADVMIGPFCYITDHDHGTAQGAIVAAQPLVEAPVVIGRNAWLGAGVKVLKGVTIGEDAVIGAGSVVTRDVPGGTRVSGVPARQLSAARTPERNDVPSHDRA